MKQQGITPACRFEDERFEYWLGEKRCNAKEQMRVIEGYGQHSQYGPVYIIRKVENDQLDRKRIVRNEPGDKGYGIEYSALLGFDEQVILALVEKPAEYLPWIDEAPFIPSEIYTLPIHNCASFYRNHHPTHRQVNVTPKQRFFQRRRGRVSVGQNLSSNALGFLDRLLVISGKTLVIDNHDAVLCFEDEVGAASELCTVGETFEKRELSVPCGLTPVLVDPDLQCIRRRNK
jgi:hypothetical protein